MTDAELHAALLHVGQSPEVYQGSGEDVIKFNQVLVDVLNKKNPVMVTEPGEKPYNAAKRIVRRVKRLLKRRGIDLNTITFESIIDWLKEHWKEVLQVLTPILILIMVLF